MDLAIIKQNYEVALVLKRAGSQPRSPEYYEGKTWTPYDIEMFI
jgi:hypothetical protein